MVLNLVKPSIPIRPIRLVTIADPGYLFLYTDGDQGPLLVVCSLSLGRMGTTVMLTDKCKVAGLAELPWRASTLVTKVNALLAFILAVASVSRILGQISI